jgi:DNA end-binding protein Ku
MSMVSCAVALYPASSESERVSFHNLNQSTGHRLRQQMVDEQTGEAVDREDRIKGYEVEKGEYVQISEEELDSIEVTNNHTIEVERFVARAEADEIYFDRSYYVIPDGPAAAETFAVIRDAMAERDVVAIARVVMFRRERILMLAPFGEAMIGTQLHYNYEVRSEDEYFEDIPKLKVGGEMLELARHIIESKSGRFEPETFKDRYQEAVVALIKAKQSGRELPKAPKSKPSNVIDLIAASQREA